MKRTHNKILLVFVSVIFSFQVMFFAPNRTQAGTMDTVKSILAQIEMIVVPWPLPLTSTEFFALLDIINLCKNDTSDAGLMQCLDQASANPTIGPLLEDSAGTENLKLGLKIYIDIKNSDYLQLMIDAGEPIGCAAAQIFTGIDICGLAKELAEIAEAIGEALEYAGEWLKELDVALFGETPHMNEAMYFQERWRPYIQDYSEFKLKGSVTDDTTLRPYLPQFSFNYGGSYASFGLDNKSLNQVYKACIDYYNGFLDDNGPKFCDNNRASFKAKVDLLVKQAQAVVSFSKVAEISLQGQNNSWSEKYETMKQDFDKKYPNRGVLDTNTYPDYLTKAVDTYKKNVSKKIGKPISDLFCLDGNPFECMKLNNSEGNCCNTMASVAYDNFKASQFKSSPTDVMKESLDKVRPSLQSYFEDLSKYFDKYWSDKVSLDNYNKVGSITAPAFQKLSDLRSVCKGLKGEMNGEKYWTLCYHSEPLESCYDKIAKVVQNKLSDMTPNELEAYVQKHKPAVEQCVEASTRVVNEWKRMDNLKPVFIEGWSKYYFDNFKKYHSTPETKNDQPHDKSILNFSLGVEYNSCVSSHMKSHESKSIALYVGSIDTFLEKSISSLSSKGLNAKATEASGKFLKAIEGKNSAPNIAEGFCSNEGYSVADPSKSKADPTKAFENNAPLPPMEPSNRDETPDRKSKKTEAVDFSKGAKKAGSAQLATYKVTAVVKGFGGSVKPNTVQEVDLGSRVKFEVRLQPGYKIRDVNGCGVMGEPESEFETAPVTADCTIRISFESSTAVAPAINNGAERRVLNPAAAIGGRAGGGAMPTTNTNRNTRGLQPQVLKPNEQPASNQPTQQPTQQPSLRQNEEPSTQPAQPTNLQPAVQPTLQPNGRNIPLDPKKRVNPVIQERN